MTWAVSGIVRRSTMQAASTRVRATSNPLWAPVIDAPAASTVTMSTKSAASPRSTVSGEIRRRRRSDRGTAPAMALEQHEPWHQDQLDHLAGAESMGWRVIQSAISRFGTQQSQAITAYAVSKEKSTSPALTSP
jgi:hypothetical protein